MNDHRQNLEKKYKVRNIGVFGSFVHGNQDENSDLDLFVEYLEDSISLFDVLDLKYYCEELFGFKVDIVTKEALKPVIGKRILSEVVFI